MDPNTECSAIINILADKIRYIKSSKKLSNRKLGRFSLLGESTIRAILKGSSNMELSTMTKLRLLFGIDLVELIDESKNISIVIDLPIKESTYEIKFLSDKRKIGKRIQQLKNARQLTPQNLSLLSYDLDYSDTIKYLKGDKNPTLITLIKYSHGLEVPLKSIFELKGPLPKNKFVGKLK